MLYFIYDYFYPAYKAGGPIQSLVNLVTAISEIQPITVICSNKDLDGSILPTKLNEATIYKYAKVYYSPNGYKGYSSLLKKSSRSTFYINGIFSWQYNFLPLLFLKGRKIISVRGMLHPDALAQKGLKKKLYLELWKLLGIHKRSEFHATSPVEKAFIQNVFGDSIKIWVISNLPRKVEYHEPPPKVEGSLTLGTIALISPMKNHLLVLQALQKCKSQVSYYIYGPIKDKAYWQQCLAVINQMPGNVTVNYMKDINSDSIEQALNKLHVYIQPSKSENFGHSLYEALAIGRPVITSMNTPWNSLEIHRAGANVEANNILEIAKCIDFFGEMGNELFVNYSLSSRNYSKKFIDFSNIESKYLEMFSTQTKEGSEFKNTLN